MQQRDRQLATFIIWFVFLILVTMAVSQLLVFQADYAGLWPSLPSTVQYGPVGPPQTVEQLEQALTFAQAAREGVMASVAESIQQQMMLRLPVAAVLTLLATLAATISTWFIWRHAGLEAHLALKALEVEKQKRRSRIERFVEELGESELVELRSRLVEDDGVVHPLGEMMKK
jgi:hypothetical protein